MIESVNLKRKASSLLLIDIAVPRDIEPNVNMKIFLAMTWMILKV